LSNPRLAGLLVLLAALCVPRSKARAQEGQSEYLGERVRVTAFGFDRKLGRLLEVRGDTLLFRPHDEPDPVPLSMLEVRRVEKSRGNYHPLRGAAIGGTLGFAAGGGVAVLLVGTGGCPSSDCWDLKTLAAVLLPWVAGGTGIVYGAVRAARTERWVTVPLASLAPPGSYTLPAEVPRGALVRVHAPGAAAQPVVAHVLGVRGDSLVLRDTLSRAETAVPVAEVQALEVGVGGSRGATARRWATTGAMITAGAVGLVSYAAASGEPGMTPWTKGVIGGVLGAPVGAVVGGVAGYAGGGRGWAQVPLPARVTVAPGRAGGVALGLDLATR
jgi:hypothetical protein